MKKINGDVRGDYSHCLLSFAAGRHIIAETPLAFGEGDIRSRIQNVMRYKKLAFWLVIVAVMICVAVAVCLLTNPVRQSHDSAVHTEDVSVRRDFNVQDFHYHSLLQ